MEVRDSRSCMCSYPCLKVPPRRWLFRHQEKWRPTSRTQNLESGSHWFKSNFCHLLMLLLKITVTTDLWNSDNDICLTELFWNLHEVLGTWCRMVFHSRHVNVTIIISTINTANNTKNTLCTYPMPDTVMELLNTATFYCVQRQLCLCTYRLNGGNVFFLTCLWVQKVVVT